MKLGKLKEIDIRKVWEHEQYDFSKWLSKEENISELGDTLGLSLTDVETEKFVGKYRCDIICKDELTGKSVLVENQLEPTNHDHLGKIITYASGLDAAVIVWIVQNARQEHASAIEWLNKHTDDEISFFLIEIHAYTIGESDPAPMFEIIEKPNDFSKSMKEYAKQGEMNASQASRLDFWNQFNDILEDRGLPFNKRKASTDHWYSVAIGSSQCHINIELVNQKHFVRTGLWIPDNKDLYDALFEKKEVVEEAAKETLTWDRMDDKKGASITVQIPGLDFSKKEAYAELINKTIDKTIRLRNAFMKYI